MQHSMRLRHKGFTLLELMVALVLIGIILSVAVLSIGDGGRGENIRQQAKRITAQFSLLSQEAVLKAQQYGVRLSPQGYQFLFFNGSKWEPVSNDSMLRERKLASGMVLRLYLDGLEVGLKSRRDDVKMLKPDLVFYSSSEQTPFVLELAYSSPPELIQRIEAKPVGAIKWQSVSGSP